MVVSLLIVVASSIAPRGDAVGNGVADLPVDFARDVQPLLSDRCFKCHGPDEAARKAGLRLDVRAAAFAAAKSGNVAIVPGDIDASELVARITEVNPRKRMPPASSGKELSEAERATLIRWIEQGAKWAGHWAWEAPRAAPLPEVRDAAWCREPLDRFVLARLEQEGLAPSAEAAPITLLRRATLALTGLPPTLAEIDAFVAESAAEPRERPRPDAYDRAVDRLLASPHYGERMVLPWLDAARYADSNGYQQDGDTFQWVWRDWMVRALNDDLPQDVLATRLIAGDLLPAPDPLQRIEQQVASGLQRCALLNGEGGAIAEEQRNVLVFDRVDVFATTFLGLTAACAQCHDHKYDPLTQRDYYSLFTFWNRVPESGVPSGSGQYRIADPWIYAGTNEQNQQRLALEQAALAADAAAAAALADPAVVAAKRDFERERDAAMARLERSPWEAAAPLTAASFDAADALPVANVASWTERPDLADGVVHPLAGENTAFFFRRTLRTTAPLNVTLRFGSDDALRVWLDGALLLERRVMRGAAPDQERAEVSLATGDHELLMQIVNGGGPGGFWFDASPAGALAEFTPPAPLAAALAQQSAARTALETLQAQLPRVMVMSDGEPRATHRLARGNYETPLETVEPAPPAFLPPLPEGAPHDRLGLAQWLTAPTNPLFARVLVNRAWQHFFATGLVKTSENFGLQGEAPSHPELLDWLAVELRTTHAMSMKALHRSIVRSAAFRQSSRLAGERGAQLRERDPENRLLARGPRQRLSSMVLRDVALAASDLLVPNVGGAPVYPYQPAGIWDGLSITKERDFAYPLSSGPDLWRRSLYTFWRRTVAPGNLFDASARQTCKVRPSVTSTPLHALTMQNDPTWIEAARALAQWALQREQGLDAQLASAFRRVCARAPDRDELALLRRTVERARDHFTADRGAGASAALQLLSVGASPRDAALDVVDHAALAIACLSILNLDEAMTCE